MSEQPKLAKNMTSDERKIVLESIRRGPLPEPMPTDKRAKDMTERERQEWLREHKRRFG